jgi:lactoylglutathione lyase
MKYLHTMVRVSDLDRSLDFYVNKLGLEELRRMDSPQGRFTLVFLAAPGDSTAQVELTYNWDPEVYGEGRNFGHIAYEVDDIYAACQRLMNAGVTINRPPRDGRMAFVRSPDNVSIELLRRGPFAPEYGPQCPTPAIVVSREIKRLYAHVKTLHWLIALLISKSCFPLAG